MKNFDPIEILLDGAAIEGPYAYPKLLPNSEIALPKTLTPFDKVTLKSADKDSFVHFYLEDGKFVNRLLNAPSYVERFRRYGGIISPDPSIYINSPDYLAKTSVWYNRIIASFYQRQDIPVIFNIRFGGPETYDFCFSGIPKGSVISFGTHGAVKNRTLRLTLEKGIYAAMEIIEPSKVIIYGTDPFDLPHKFKHITFQIIPSEISTKLGRAK